MSKYFLTITNTIFVFLLASILSMGNASTSNTIELTSIVEQEVTLRDEQGNKIVKRVPAEKVLPGKEVIYTTRFKNNGSEPAENVIISNPVPQHTVYKLNSASGKNTQVMFSANGGKSFHFSNQLRAIAEDGSERVAEAKDYTDIRWIYQGQLQPGGEGVVEFRVVLQ